MNNFVFHYNTLLSLSAKGRKPESLFVLQYAQMSEDIDIKKLAELARVDLDEATAKELKGNIADILSYVASVQAVAGEEKEPQAGAVRNVLREDGEPHAPGAYREALLREAPAVDEAGFVVVPPIL
jgi:aspartyl-tRNA(Asn)/glutamyl-tRNA(Gln) amidotransferase subunit C